VVPFFRAIAAAHQEAHLLCVTSQPDRMRELLSAGGVAPERCTVASVPQPQVADYLSAGDAGFLLRAPSRINRFSQPTKLGEYLAAGLPVVVARGTGDVDRLVERHGVGVVAECFGTSEARLREEGTRAYHLLSECGEAMRTRALALCEREFLWRSYTASVRAAYQRALEW
jgi:glycosyltransferase involved in cell wall biosynthesis